MHLRCLILLFTAACAAAGQQVASIAVPADARERVKTIFAPWDHTDTPGCAVGVAVNGAELLRAAWGMADLEHGVAITPDTVFEAGSVSKQFTAAAILLLAQKGRISLSDPVSKYFPELPDYGRPITLEQLLHHTSGLRDWDAVAAAAGWPRTTREYSNAWVLDIASRQKTLNYAPGEEWSYTNTGYNLLAILVQRVSGRSLAEFTHDEVFLPMGMTSTSWRDNFQRIVPRRAIAYEWSDGDEHQLMPFENAYGNGGMLTTVDDLLRWNDRFVKAGIGGTGFVNSELETGHLNDGRPLFYAAGLFLAEHDGYREISHSGSTAGYRAWLGYYPDQKLSVALLCNAAEADTTHMGHAVADVYLPAAQAKTDGKAEIVLAADPEGLYESRRDHSVFLIERKEGRLLARRKYPLIPVSADAFRLQPEGARFELVTDAVGKVTGIREIYIGYELDRFDRVQQAHPATPALDAFTGEYVSDEAETTYKVVLTPQGLEIHQRPDAVYPLRPAYADGFDSELGGIRFQRDVSGRVTGLSLGNSRMWELRFRRVDAH